MREHEHAVRWNAVQAPERSRGSVVSQPRECVGFTLVELVVVIAILVIVAGVVILSADRVLHGSDGRGGAIAGATRASLVNVRDAIDGPPGRPGFKQDLGELPARITDLFRSPLALPSGKPVQGTPLAQFDPVTRRGWNGPYLQRNTGAYHVDNAHGFTSAYAAEHDPALLDGWGHAIVLQIPPAPPAATLEERFAFARLVSAGADGVIVTQPQVLAPNVDVPADVGDDVVLYLFRANGP